MSEHIIDIEDDDEAYSETTRKLLDMIRSPHSMTAMRAASSKSATERVLLEGLKHSVAAVRQACVVNPKATHKVIALALMDEDGAVIIEALKSKLVSEHDMMNVVERSNDMGVFAEIASKSKRTFTCRIIKLTTLNRRHRINRNTDF